MAPILAITLRKLGLVQFGVGGRRSERESRGLACMASGNLYPPS